MRPTWAAGPTSSVLIKEALDAAKKIRDEGDKADALNIIVMAQARSGDVAGARKTADAITKAFTKDFAYGHIAEALAR